MDIKQAIQEGIPDAEVHVDMHDGVHVEAVVISREFEGKSLVQQHQMVKRLLKGHFEMSLHALSLKTYTPERWENEH